jgi:hypothetical protein
VRAAAPELVAPDGNPATAPPANIQSKPKQKIGTNLPDINREKTCVKLKLNFFSENAVFAVPLWTGRCIRLVTTGVDEGKRGALRARG